MAIDLIASPAHFAATVSQVRAGHRHVGWLLQSQLGAVALYGPENIPLGWTFSSRDAALAELRRLWTAAHGEEPR